ncbi:MAG: hypothetical protein NXI31_24780 [bacterium]|nr:hypothetical protein [bacterium]
MSKWLWVALGGLTICGMVWASLLADTPGWDEAQRWYAERRLAWQQDGCPVVSGWPKNGCSRADYLAASKLADAMSDDLVIRLSAIEGEGELTAEDRAAVAPVIAVLRQGAARIDDVDEHRARFGPLAVDAMVDCISMHNALLALRVTARSTAREDQAAAAELLRDGITVAMDFATAGTGLERLIGINAVDLLARDFDDATLRALEVPALQKLGRALEDIAAVLPPVDDFFEREIAFKVAYVQDGGALDSADLGVPRWETWRHGFSMRSFVISQVCLELDLLNGARERADPKTATWPERQQALAWIQAEVEKQPMTYMMRRSFADFEKTRRQAAAALAMLRQAVAFHAGAAVPEMSDPLGGAPIRVTVAGDTATFASAEQGYERTARRTPR